MNIVARKLFNIGRIASDNEQTAIYLFIDPKPQTPLTLNLRDKFLGCARQSESTFRQLRAEQQVIERA